MAMLGYIWITALMLLPVVQPDPEWPRFWTLRPMLTTPLVTGLGALVLYRVRNKYQDNRWVSVLTWLLLIPLFWIATILGFDGTLWN